MLWLLVMVQGLMSSVQRLTDVALSQLFLPAQPDPTSLTRQKELSAIELSLLSLLICNSYCTCSICAHDLAFRRALRKVAWELSGVQLCAGVWEILISLSFAFLLLLILMLANILSGVMMGKANTNFRKCHVIIFLVDGCNTTTEHVCKQEMGKGMQEKKVAFPAGIHDWLLCFEFRELGKCPGQKLLIH